MYADITFLTVSLEGPCEAWRRRQVKLPQPKHEAGEKGGEDSLDLVVHIKHFTHQPIESNSASHGHKDFDARLNNGLHFDTLAALTEVQKYWRSSILFGRDNIPKEGQRVHFRFKSLTYWEDGFLVNDGFVEAFLSDDECCYDGLIFSARRNIHTQKVLGIVKLGYYDADVALLNIYIECVRIGHVYNLYV